MVSFGHSMKTAVRKWLVGECMKAMGNESRVPYAIITDLVKENEDKFPFINESVLRNGVARAKKKLEDLSQKPSHGRTQEEHGFLWRNVSQRLVAQCYLQGPR